MDHYDGLWRYVRRRTKVAIGVALGGVGLAAATPELALRYVWHTLEPKPLPAPPAPPPLASVHATTCAVCHPDQYEDWSASRMGQAMTDPVFLADYEAQGRPFVCLFCHAPRIDQQPTIATGIASLRPLRAREEPNPTFDPALQREGVTCVVCHQQGDVLVGPDGDAAPHPTARDPVFREATRCVRCHQVAAPPLSHLDRPLADTHGEWAAWQAVTGRTETCVDCHMPGRAHTFPGAWDPALLRAGLGVDVAAVDGVVRVTLTNRAGHRFPTADPARALVVRHGAAEAVIARRVPLPRYRDEGDNTLLPAETRVIELRASPGEDVVVSLYPLRFLAGADGDPAVEISRTPLPLPD